MNARVYVENLPAATSAADLRNLFSPYGNVVDVKLTVDRDSQKPLGFGFVTMVTPEGARAAIQALHGKQIATRTLMVTETRPPGIGPTGNQLPKTP